MSKNINGIMGPQVGKIGTVVGYVANGKMIYRAYQRNVKNPQTPAQQAHRFKLKTLSLNMQSFVDDPELALDYDRLVVAQGRLAGVVITNEGSLAEGFGYRLRFAAEVPGGNLPTDMLVGALWCPALRETVDVNGILSAGAFVTDVALRETWRGHDIHVYAAMVNTLNEPSWLPSRHHDGNRQLLPHETSNTAHLKIA